MNNLLNKTFVMFCLSGLILPFVFGAKAPQKPLMLQWESVDPQFGIFEL